MPVSFVKEEASGLFKLTETCANCGHKEVSYRKEFPGDIVAAWSGAKEQYLFCRNCCLEKHIPITKEGVHYVFF